MSPRYSAVVCAVFVVSACAASSPKVVSTPEALPAHCQREGNGAMWSGSAAVLADCGERLLNTEQRAAGISMMLRAQALGRHDPVFLEKLVTSLIAEGSSSSAIAALDLALEQTGDVEDRRQVSELMALAFDARVEEGGAEGCWAELALARSRASAPRDWCLVGNQALACKSQAAALAAYDLCAPEASDASDFRLRNLRGAIRSRLAVLRYL